MKFSLDLEFDDLDIKMNCLTNKMVAIASAKALTGYWGTVGMIPQIIVDVDTLPEETVS